MKVDDIPGFEFNAATNTVKLPMGKLFTGWYYHETDVLGFNDAGVFEWYGFPNEYSLFEGCNWGFAENLMSVKKDGEIMNQVQRDNEKIARHQEKEGEYEWKAPRGEDAKRR